MTDQASSKIQTGSGPLYKQLKQLGRKRCFGRVCKSPERRITRLAATAAKSNKQPHQSENLKQKEKGGHVSTGLDDIGAAEVLTAASRTPKKHASRSSKTKTITTRPKTITLGDNSFPTFSALTDCSSDEGDSSPSDETSLFTDVTPKWSESKMNMDDQMPKNEENASPSCLEYQNELPVSGTRKHMPSESKDPKQTHKDSAKLFESLPIEEKECLKKDQTQTKEPFISEEGSVPSERKKQSPVYTPQLTESTTDQTKRGDRSDNERGKKSDPAAALAPATSGWSCEQCTFVNRRRARHCKMCEGPKPVEGTIRANPKQEISTSISGPSVVHAPAPKTKKRKRNASSSETNPKKSIDDPDMRSSMGTRVGINSKEKFTSPTKQISGDLSRELKPSPTNFKQKSATCDLEQFPESGTRPPSVRNELAGGNAIGRSQNYTMETPSSDVSGSTPVQRPPGPFDTNSTKETNISERIYTAMATSSDEEMVLLPKNEYFSLHQNLLEYQLYIQQLKQQYDDLRQAHERLWSQHMEQQDKLRQDQQDILMRPLPSSPRPCTFPSAKSVSQFSTEKDLPVGRPSAEPHGCSMVHRPSLDITEIVLPQLCVIEESDRQSCRATSLDQKALEEEKRIGIPFKDHLESQQCEMQNPVTGAMPPIYESVPKSCLVIRKSEKRKCKSPEKGHVERQQSESTNLDAAETPPVHEYEKEPCLSARNEHAQDGVLNLSEPTARPDSPPKLVQCIREDEASSRMDSDELALQQGKSSQTQTFFSARSTQETCSQPLFPQSESINREAPEPSKSLRVANHSGDLQTKESTLNLTQLSESQILLPPEKEMSKGKTKYTADQNLECSQHGDAPSTNGSTAQFNPNARQTTLDGKIAVGSSRPAFRKLPLGNSTNNETCPGSLVGRNLNSDPWVSNAPSRTFIKEMADTKAITGSGNQSVPFLQRLSEVWHTGKRRPVSSNAPPVQKGLWDDVSQEQEPNYKYKEVVRCKSKRQGLPCHDCADCRAFYEVLRRSGDNIANSQSTIQYSRHRARFAPPDTPADFWTLDFIDEKEARENAKRDEI